MLNEDVHAKVLNSISQPIHKILEYNDIIIIYKRKINFPGISKKSLKY